MADYTPIYTPGTTQSHTTSASVTGRQLLAVSGTGTVGPAGANAVNWIGTAAQDAISGARVAVFAGGVQELTASGAVTAGDLLVAAAAGQVSTLAAVTTPTPADVTNTRAIVGVALTTAGNGALVRVAMAR